MVYIYIYIYIHNSKTHFLLQTNVNYVNLHKLIIIIIISIYPRIHEPI